MNIVQLPRSPIKQLEYHTQLMKRLFLANAEHQRLMKITEEGRPEDYTPEQFEELAQRADKVIAEFDQIETEIQLLKKQT